MMNKLHFLNIFLLMLCVSFKGYSDNLTDLDAWSKPISFELMLVAGVDLSAINITNENLDDHAGSFITTTSNFFKSAFVAPPCPTEGTACDDGNPNTINDVIAADCVCRGIAITPATSCETAGISYELNNGGTKPGVPTLSVFENDKIAFFSNLENVTVRDPNSNLIPNNTIDEIKTSGVYTVNGTYKRTSNPIVQSVSSQHATTGNNSISAAFDNDTETFWHSNYAIPAAGYDHELVLDMGPGSILSGFTYLPRQGACDGCTNGRIGGYEIYVSNSAVKAQWGTVVRSGAFANTDALETVTFPATSGRYLIFVAKSPAIPGQAWATAAEFTVRRAGTITTASSLATNPASNATDKNNGTFWLSNTSVAGTRHSLTLDLGIETNVTSLEYLPRQSGTAGRITNYEVYVSNSLADFGTAVTIGAWTYATEPLAVRRTAVFPEKKGRYVRLVSTSPTNVSASAAEVRAISNIDVACSRTMNIVVDKIETYTYNGTWSPTAPTSVNSTINDIINIASGNAIISNNIAANSLIVKPGAALTVNDGVIITANTTNLESTSTMYSSLILDGTGTVTGAINYELYTNRIGTALGGGNDLISAPLANVTFGNFATANTNLAASDTKRALAPYNTIAGAYQNYDTATNAATVLASGAGFRAATPGGSNLIFTGDVAKTNVAVTITADGLGKAWNLIGNPYPSYIDGKTFLSPGNIALMDNRYAAVYGYNGSKNGWKTFNLTDDNILIAPGQGFFVKSNMNGGLIQFTPAMRSAGSSDDFIVGRPTNSNKALSKLKLSSGSNDVFTSIYFIEGTTKGLDPGYDAAAYAASKVDFSMFTNLLEDNSGLDIAIQSLPYNDFNGVIVPLGIQAKAGVELSIGIDELSTLPSNINVYLEDTKNETLTLLNDGDFKFIPTTDVKVNGRFNVHYSAKTLSVEDLDANDNLRIYTTTSPRSLFIVGQLAKATKANLYDIQGRLVLSRTLNPNTTENTIDISTLGTGIYVVKVNNDNQIKTQKVIIK